MNNGEDSTKKLGLEKNKVIEFAVVSAAFLRRYFLGGAVDDAAGGGGAAALLAWASNVASRLCRRFCQRRRLVGCAHRFCER